MRKILSLRERLQQALVEDGADRDITTSVIPRSRRLTSARLLAKAAGVFCGGSLIQPILHLIDREARASRVVRNGTVVRSGVVLARIRARESSLLACERLILNLICHLSGIATLTHRYVDAVKGTPTRIVDTRKTTPLWRDLEREAVRSGGGTNNRFSLSDAVLVKDNHWQLLRERKIEPAAVYGLRSSLRKKASFVEIEAKSIPEVWGAIKARPDIILLDNMGTNRIKEAVVLIKAARKALGTSAPLIEVSGGVTVENARELARLGIDRISVGALTHSAPALDISLEVD